jgi:hypothetical protein
LLAWVSPDTEAVAERKVEQTASRAGELAGRERSKVDEIGTKFCMNTGTSLA